MKKPNIAKFLDGFVLASKGILMALKEKKFIIGFFISFVFFGMLMNLLSGGFAKFALMDSFIMVMQIFGDCFIKIFGVGMAFLDWLPVFLLALLQGVLIGLIVLLWSKKRESNSANVEKAGIITGLIALGAGCPTCGTTLLTPILGALFSAGGLAAAGTVSTIITVVAVIIAILSLRKLGEETYVIMVNEKYMRKKEVHENRENH